MNGKLNLMLHAGGHKVEREALAAVETPPATATWQPIPHHTLLNRVQESLGAAGWELRGEAHALSHQGQRYFGLMEVGLPTDDGGDYSLVAGLRNSHDQSIPAGLAVGSQVFICDNLAFSSEIKLARKHTRYIERDLPRLIATAVAQLHDHRRHQDGRIAAYKQHGLTNAEAHDTIIQALDARIIGATAVPKVLEQWRTPEHEEFQERTGWSLFNAFTEVMKGNLTTLFPRTQALHGLLDGICKLAV